MPFWRSINTFLWAGEATMSRRLPARTWTPYRDENAQPVYRRRKFFRYDALDSRNPKAIRLVRVKGALCNGFIDCEIWHSDTSSGYSALSYVWDRPGGRHHILLNGRTFRVEKNLWDFLDVARRHLTNTTIWVDAICIAQDDLHEKNHQVQMMSTIYSQAKKAFIWLGSEWSFAGQALKLINTNAGSSDVDIIEACMQNHGFWEGLNEIHRSDYWHRAWILQEFVLPRQGILMANEHFTDFEAFQKLIGRIELILSTAHSTSSLSSIGQSFYSTVTLGGRDLWLMRQKAAKDQRLNLFNYHTYNGTRGAHWLMPKACSNVKDRLFAILAFTKHGSSFKVDYHLNPLDILLESIWLEHTDRISMVEQLSLTACLLNITPLSIMLYSDRRQQMLRDTCSGKTVAIPADVDPLHSRSASSKLDSERWLRLAAPSREISGRFWDPWSSCASEGEEVTLLNGLYVPRKARRRFALSFDGSDVFLVVAVSLADHGPTEPKLASPLDRDTVFVNDDLTDDEFLEQRPKCCRVHRIYDATCTPKPMRVYYALLENPLMLTEVLPRTFDDGQEATDGSMTSVGSR
ncbi:MAG: hypothetical protein CMP47_08270 [Rickettsiales bacterium]|nr:hypothetical protein [Rickettsiales bacterium]